MNYNSTNKKEDIQENQYSFPYHHLTHEVNGAIYTFRHLFWGLIHYTYIQVVIETIKKIEFETLADIGCGEGRIIYELKKNKLAGKFYGYDISDRAIKFAQAFSPNTTFSTHDITQSPLKQPTDVIVSCEVIEHIEPSKVKNYIENIYHSLNPRGKIIITTPTTNVPVNKKHYQHFTADMFDSLLQGKFSDIKYTYLNQVNQKSRLLERLLANRIYISNFKPLNKFILKHYKKHYLYADKTTGSRILVEATKIN